MQLQRAEDLYRIMLTARKIDERERVLVAQNLAHFHASGTGHEAVAALAAHLIQDDYLHAHYRDKALLLARGVPAVEFFRSLLCRADSHSAGRQMCAHMSASDLHILSLVGPVGNNVLQAVGVAAAIKDRPAKPVVVCSVGDGTTQEGEFYEAAAEAVRRQLPVLFLVENNRYAISTVTSGQTFFDLPTGPARDLFGIPIQSVDGRDVMTVDAAFSEIVANVRRTRCPAVLVMNVERLCDHSNADDQARYRPQNELPDALRSADPLANLEEFLRTSLNGRSSLAPINTVKNPAADDDPLQSIQVEVKREIDEAVKLALDAPSPVACLDAKSPLPRSMIERSEHLGHSDSPRLTMQQAINTVLRDRLKHDPRVFLQGEDIEDPKGDVFGVSRGLSTSFPGRVVNSALSESTIIGTSIGRALAGQRPVAFIQFADFLPLAYNQILSELGSMYWRTNGTWQCPVILMVTCGGYKPGLGPFHAQTLESVMAHTPGIDVVMPSYAGDAAGLLNAAFESGRPTIFFYPKSCLNLADRATSSDVSKQFVLLGKARQLRGGNDLTLVSWGSPIEHCLKCVDTLETVGVSVDMFDLRSLSPWDRTAIIASAEKTGRLVVVHEDNSTCGFGAEVLAAVAEATTRSIQCRRVTRPDTYIPCNFANQLQVLPSFERVLETCAELLEIDVKWLRDVDGDSGIGIVRAPGSGPADDRVELIEIQVRVGDEINVGQTIAVVEATKSVVDIVSNMAGKVIEVLAQQRDRVAVGQPLVRVKLSEAIPIAQNHASENVATPLLRRRSPDSRAPVHHTNGRPTEERLRKGENSFIYLTRPSCALGSRVISTESIAENIPGWTAADAIKRTGIELRHWIADGETAVSLTTQAANQLLDSLGPDVPKITAVLCSATAPQMATPSVACQVATNLRDRNCFADNWFALDFNAACSGFLYGLRLAFDHLQDSTSEAVLLLTSEVLSPLLDKRDPATAFLFGDAASAVLVTGKRINGEALGVYRPVLFSSPDPRRTIQASCFDAPGYLQMDGMSVALTAYAHMVDGLNVIASDHQIKTSELGALVAHPGSKSILQKVAAFADIPPTLVHTTLATTGNTSSTSIPLALDRFWNTLPRQGSIGFVAFGAGYTSAAAIGEFSNE